MAASGRVAPGPQGVLRNRSSPDARSTRFATVVAGRIVDDVVARGWPVGEVLGSEADLVERYGVSRPVFREAVRLVEQQHVAHMRSGLGGGLVVTEPTVDAVVDAAVLYLHRVGARLDEVFDARRVLEEIVTDLAPARVDATDVERLQALIALEKANRSTDNRALHAMLASITRNPALELFVDILNRVSLLYYSAPMPARTKRESVHADERLAEAVLAGDSDLARNRMRKHLEAEAEFLRRRRSTHQVLDPATAITSSPGGKAAEGVARAIFYDIIVQGLDSGALLGSESELVERYRVSRPVFREAVRLLEHHHIARMRRGPGGGLFVVPPSVAAVTDIVALYLARKGIEGAHLAELRIRVELELVDLAIDRTDEAGDAALDASLERELRGTDADRAEAQHDLHATVASVAGNRALELVALVLIRLTRLVQLDLPASAQRRIRAEIHRTHQGISDAIQVRDHETAARRMQRHLEAVAAFL